MNEHLNVIKDYNAPLKRITWPMLWSQPPKTISRLNNQVTVHIQSKVIIWSCGKNKRAVLIPGLSPLLPWISPPPPPRLISKHCKWWWTVPMYVEPLLLYITKISKYKEFELTHTPLKWNIEWVNLDIRACKMLVWAAD